MNLDELFEKYKNISIEIISALEEDNLLLVDKMLIRRKNIIENIINICDSKEQLRESYVKNDLFAIDKVMKEKFQNKMSELKQEIKNLRKKREATKKYNNLSSKAVFLSKEI